MGWNTFANRASAADRFWGPDVDDGDIAKYAFAVARRIVRDEQDALDVAQDALLSAFRHRDSFRGEAAPRTWLHRIVVTTALSHLRSAARRQRHLAAVAEEPRPQLEEAPDEALAAQRQVARVRSHVAMLEEKYRAVLALRLEELSDAQIARRLDITVGSVKVRSHRARHQLRAALEPVPA
jgi:RNA polymerase sigma-70 factor, ECF subfamily